MPPATGLISGTIDATANVTTPYDVTVKVNDGSISASESFAWFVSHLSLTNPGPQTNATGDVVSLGLSVQDNGGDALSFQAADLPPGLSIDGATGVISGAVAATADAASPYTVTVSATDGGSTASQTFSWAVARIVVIDPGMQSDADGDAVTLQVTAQDNNPDTLTYGATGLPTGLSINGATGLISGVIAPTADAGGPYTVVVTASDGVGHSSSDTFLWTVTPLTLSNPGDQQNAAGDEAYVQLLGQGGGPAPLTYVAAGLPQGLSIDPSTGLITGTIDPTAASSTPYTVAVTASDGLGASASQSYNWSVDAIYLADPGGQIYDANQAVTLPVVAHDDDGDALTYGVSGLPAGLLLSGSQIVGTVAASAVSAIPYSVVETVTNALGQVATAAFTMTVGDAPVKTATLNLDAWIDTNRDWNPEALEPGAGSNADVLLYNASGQKVATLHPGQNGLATQNLAPGTYTAEALILAPYSLEIMKISGLSASGNPIILSIDATTHRSQSFTLASGTNATLYVALMPTGSPTGQILGPSVVPGNSSYIYTVTFDHLVAASQWMDSVITPVSPPANVVQLSNLTRTDLNNQTSVSVELTFGNSVPAQVILSLTYGPGQKISIPITVVEVQIENPPVGTAAFTSNPTPTLKGPAASDFGTMNDIAAVGVKSDSADGKQDALTSKAQVVLTGPNGNQGVDKIEVGFIQHITSSVQAVYTAGPNASEMLTLMYMGKPLSAYIAVLDKAGLNPNPDLAWYDQSGTGVFDNATPQVPTGPISTEDSPQGAFPLTYNQAPATVLTLPTWPGLDLITKILYTDTFTLDIAATTTDATNNASSLYYAEASVPWSFLGSGTVQLKRNAASPKDSTLIYTPDANNAVLPPTSWLVVAAPTLVPVWEEFTRKKG